MTDSPSPKIPRDLGNWAAPVEMFSVNNVPASAINLNVAGKRVAGPLHGFGQLWQKTYRLTLKSSDMTPQEVVAIWKSKFPQFWPKGNNFYGGESGVTTGEVAVLNLAMPGGMTISTGIRVIYSDDLSFAFITPEGHMFGGMITFSAETDNDADATCVQIQALVRASDPIYEVGCRLGFAHKVEDRFWHGTLANLAAYCGAAEGVVAQQNVCVDTRMQWSEAKNVWQNAAIRTALYMPVHWAKQLFTSVA